GHIVARLDGQGDTAQGLHRDAVEVVRAGDVGGDDGRNRLGHGSSCPALTWSAPATTMRCPASTPAVTSTESSPCTPRVTGTRSALPDRTTQTVSLPSAVTTAEAGTVTASVAW